MLAVCDDRDAVRVQSSEVAPERGMVAGYAVTAGADEAIRIGRFAVGR